MYKTWLLVVAIGLWLANSLRVFWNETTPPYCNSQSITCLTPKIRTGQPYVLHLYASDSPRSALETSKNTVPRLTRAKRHEYLGSIRSNLGEEHLCDKNEVISTSSKTAGSVDIVKKGFGKRLMSGFRSTECRAKIAWTIGDEWRTNSTMIYLYGLATDVEDYTQQLFLSTLQPVSLMYTPEPDRQAKTRYLLTGEDNEKLPPIAQVTSMSIPRVVRIGPMYIQDPLDYESLRSRGAHYWRIANTKNYVTPLTIDTLVSPRDEYDSLLSPDPIVMTTELMPISWRKAALQRQMLAAINMMEKQFGTSQYESDSLKLLLAGESPLILLLTFIVSSLHLIFEMLAMSSNWSHFSEATKDRESSDRVSARSVLLDVLFEIAILAWLRDTGEAKIIQYILLARIAFNSWKYWKLRSTQTIEEEPVEKVTEVCGFWETCRRPLSLSQLRIMRSTMSADAFEAACLRTLTFVLSPIMISLCIYQLIFVPHKSWLSWIIKSFALTSYIGGFIAMTPQLYKNFYFRSVEHLPWTTLTYQFLNTIIDDLFSFLIRMPKEHRMSVFRDDIVFVIYWLQKKHYKGSKGSTQPVLEMEGKKNQ